MTRVQVFTTTHDGGEACEIDAEHFSSKVADGAYRVKTREKDGQITEHIFPLAQLRMVRMWKSKKEKN